MLIPSGDEVAEEAIEEEHEEEPEEEHEEEDEEEHAEEGGHGSSAPKEQYLQMEILTLPVLRGNALNHHLHVEANLQTPDTRAAREIQANMPHLRDAIIRDFFRTPLTVARGTKVDDAVLKQRLLAVAKRVLGEDVVEDVLLVNIIRRGR